MDSIQKNIDEVLSEFMYDPVTKKRGSKSSGVTSTTLVEYGPEKTQVTNIVHSMFHGLIRLSEIGKLPDMIDILFTIVFSTRKVGFFGKIQVTETTLESSDGLFTYEDIENAGGKSSNFLKKIHSTLQKYPFLGLYTSIKSKEGYRHGNIILIYKSGQNSVFISIYEPHGSLVKKSGYWKERTITKAVSSIEKGYNKLYKGGMINIGRLLASCPIGLQTSVGTISESGFCKLYSFLWLYVLMRVMSKQVDSAVNLIIIQRIEGAIMGSPILGEDRKATLATIITNFGFWAVNLTIECYGMVYGKINLYEYEQQVHMKLLKNVFKDKIKYLGLGSKCRHNVECTSGICYNGICVDEYYLQKRPNAFKKFIPVPSEGPYKTGKKKGKQCLINEDCKSGICIQGKDEDYGVCA